MKEPPPFHLYKWYVDVISDEGDAFIGYVARLTWRKITVHYVSAILFRKGEEPRIISRFGKAGFPEVAGDDLIWESGLLDIRGRWKLIDDGIRYKLFDQPAGTIDWDCCFPKAAAHVAIGGQLPIQGLGYAENITLTIAPWNLPLEELRWGRFISETDCLIWIDWKGAESYQWTFLNGTQLSPAHISKDEIVFEKEEIRLDMGDHKVIREGPVFSKLITNLVKFIPGIKKIVPLDFINGSESKWLSKGVLKREGKSLSSGWVIHEVVRFR